MLVIALAALISVSSPAQFKEQTRIKPNVYEAIVQPKSPRNLLSLFDLNRLTMRHSFSISYINLGGKSIMVNRYTNSLFYRFSDKLNLRADISFVHSPFNSFGKDMDINGVYLNLLELNYRPSKNLFINLRYRQVPIYWDYHYPYYYYPW